MKSADLRATLQTIADGRDPRLAAVFGPATLHEKDVKLHQPAFRAWGRFAVASLKGAGEPLAAPVEILAPLP